MIKYFKIGFRCPSSPSINNIGFNLKFISINLIDKYIELIKESFLYISPKKFISSLLYLFINNLNSSINFLYFSSFACIFSFKLYFNILLRIFSCKLVIKFDIEVFSNIFNKERREFSIFINLLSIVIESFLSKRELIFALSLFIKENIFLFRIINIDVFISVESIIWYIILIINNKCDSYSKISSGESLMNSIRLNNIWTKYLLFNKTKNPCFPSSHLLK